METSNFLYYYIITQLTTVTVRLVIDGAIFTNET
jgi:hypothetical protein